MSKPAPFLRGDDYEIVERDGVMTIESRDGEPLLHMTTKAAEEISDHLVRHFDFLNRRPR